MEYRVVKMKPLADELHIKPAKTFGSTENYLASVINIINENSAWTFHQYLFLVDTFYVVLKKGVEQVHKSPPPSYNTASRVAPQMETEPYQPETSPEEMNAKVEESMSEIKDKEYAQKNLKKVKLSWKDN